MSEKVNGSGGFGREVRAWVESVPTLSAETVRSDSARRRRERRRRRASTGALSVVLIAAAIIGLVKLDPTGTSDRGSTDPATVDPLRPNGCSTPAELFGDGFAAEVVDGRAQLFGMPPDAIVSVVEGGSLGRQGLVDVVSVDDPSSLSDEHLDGLRNADRREVFVVQRCGELRTITALASDLRNSLLGSEYRTTVSKLGVEVDDRRGLVVITGPRALADQLLLGVNGDASFIEFRSAPLAGGD